MRELPVQLSRQEGHVPVAQGMLYYAVLHGTSSAGRTRTFILGLSV
jgi:hypothetical protein